MSDDDKGMVEISTVAFPMQPGATVSVASEFAGAPVKTFSPITREQIERWLDRQGVAIGLMTESEIVGHAMKQSGDRVDPLLVREALQARAVAWGQ